MTELVWSNSIGKRVRVGDWADQAVPTLTKARQAIAEAGDVFGPGNRIRVETASEFVWRE